MITLLKVIHVIVAVLLVIVVLMQFGRGSEIGAVFGGTSTQAVFGSSAPTILEKITMVLAAIFMITSAVLAYLATRPSTVFDRAPVEQKMEKTPGTFPGEATGLEK